MSDMSSDVVKDRVAFKWKDWTGYIDVETYSEGQAPALIFKDDGPEPIAVLTVNIPGVLINDDEVLIKNYSENETILEALVDQGIVEDTGSRERSGFVSIPVCKVINNTLLRKIKEYSS